MSAADVVKAWSDDGRSVFVAAGFSVPARIERVDITTGARTFVRELAPPDRAGLVAVRLNQWISDGRAYVYTYSRNLSKLFVGSGVR